MNGITLPPDVLWWPSALLAVACYGLAGLVRQAILRVPQLAPARPWRRLLVPGLSTLLGLVAGLARIPGLGTLGLDLLAAAVAGMGPVVWTSFGRGLRRAMAERGASR